MMTSYIFLDVETQSLAARYDSNVPVWCVGLAFKQSTGMPLVRVYEWDDDIKDHLNYLCKRDDVQFVMHNASFDVAVLRKHGVNIPQGKYHCSLLAAYLLRPGLGHSLADYGDKLGYPKLECEDWRHGNTEELMKYCAVDVEITYKLWYEVIMPAFNKDSILSRAYQKIELPYVEAIMEMESTGMYIDTDKLNLLKVELDERIENLEQTIRATTSLVPAKMQWNINRDKKYTAVSKEYKNGYHKNKKNKSHYIHNIDVCSSCPEYVYDHTPLEPFKASKSRHLCWVLEQQGWTPTVFTEGGEPSTESDVIADLDYPIAKQYSEINELTKLLNTFVCGIRDNLDSHHVIRCSYNQCVTVTTRLSSSKPNLQNLPSRSALGKRVRDCVIAPPGYTLVVADLDRIELKVLAYYLETVVGETRMADAARANVDMHQANADAWGVTRSKAKNGIFAVNYGSQAKTLSKTIGCTEDEAQHLIDSIYENMPALSELMKRVWDMTRNNDGVLYTLLGQRLYYPDINSHNKWDRLKAQRQVFNALIQGTSAAIQKELTLRVMPIIHKYGGAISFAVHDETGAYIPTENIEAALVELNKVYYNTDILNSVPVTGEFIAGHNWNECKE